MAVKGMNRKAAVVVNSAVLGLDMEVVMVGGVAYTIHPPTIRRICGAAYHLAIFNECDKSVMRYADSAAKALSWFVAGDESLSETFQDAPLDDVTQALAVAVGMLSTRNFTMLSVLAKSVGELTAKPKR